MFTSVKLTFMYAFANRKNSIQRFKIKTNDRGYMRFLRDFH